MSSQGTPEDMLSSMFKKFSGITGGQSIDKMLDTLIRNTQINMLKHLRRDIDSNIRKLTQEGAVEMAYDESLNPYKILDVSQDATKDEIVKAFRKKAKAAHPDMASGSKEEMVKVNAAFEAIKQFRGWK